jgi:thymidylate synthase
MRYNYVFPSLNQGLPVLCEDLLNAEQHDSRNGVTREMMHVGVTYTDPLDRYTTIPTRKPNLAAQIAETMWVLAGRNDLEFLSHYLPRAGDFSDDGMTWRAAYGPRIRAWDRRESNTFDDLPVDQLKRVIGILKADPNSRQAVIGIWDPDVDATPDPVKDRACNNWLNFSIRNGMLDLHVAVRSNDLIWGHSGINVFEWSVLQEIVAGMVGATMGALHFSITSLHLYGSHFDKAEKITTQPIENLEDDLISRTLFDARTVDHNLKTLDDRIQDWFKIEEMIRENGVSHDILDMVDAFPEPLLRSWLRVIMWWWTGNHGYLKPIAGTALELATHYSMQPKALVATGFVGGRFANVQPVKPFVTPFMAWAINIHNEKHEAYGDSWKKRGEMMSILANIARKIDRLDSGKDTTDESQVDTATDLMVYLAKYQSWLIDPARSDSPDDANFLLKSAENTVGDDEGMSDSDRVEYLSSAFEHLAFIAENARDNERKKQDLVGKMLWYAYRLASLRWSASQEVVDTPCCAEHPFCDHTDDYKGADID